MKFSYPVISSLFLSLLSFLFNLRVATSLARIDLDLLLEQLYQIIFPEFMIFLSEIRLMN